LKNLVCFAVREEGHFYRPGAGTEVLYTGMGAANARKALSKYLHEERPDHVFSAGFAGGLDPMLRLGTVVFNSQDAAISKTLEKQGARGCNFLWTEKVAVTVAEKNRLRADSGADAVEMESQVIGDICRETNIPCSIVRVISDTALEDLPLDFNQVMTQGKRINFPKLALSIIISPGRIPKLIAFRKRTIFAAEKLGTALSELTGSMSSPS